MKNSEIDLLHLVSGGRVGGKVAGTSTNCSTYLLFMVHSFHKALLATTTTTTTTTTSLLLLPQSDDNQTFVGTCVPIIYHDKDLLS